MPPFNGHKNWNHWNVCLWINNDERLYRLAQWAYSEGRSKADAAACLLYMLTEDGFTKTPDGAPYTVTTLRAALRGF